MAAILADHIFKCIFLNRNDRILIQISPKYGPKSPAENKAALVQVMVRRRIGDKPLPEPMMTQFSIILHSSRGVLADGPCHG